MRHRAYRRLSVARVWRPRKDYVAFKCALALTAAPLFWLWAKLMEATNLTGSIWWMFTGSLCVVPGCLAIGLIEQRLGRLVRYAGLAAVATVIGAALYADDPFLALMAGLVFGLASCCVGLLAVIVGSEIGRIFYRISFRKGPWCPQCGYSLIGCETHTCPECGRAFTFDEIGVDRENLRAAAHDEALRKLLEDR